MFVFQTKPVGEIKQVDKILCFVHLTSIPLKISFNFFFFQKVAMLIINAQNVANVVNKLHVNPSQPEG